MARQEGGLIPQGKESAPNGLEQLLVIATRKIGASDGACKQHIADDGEVVLGLVEHDVTWRMARAVDDIEAHRTHRDPIAMR